MSVTEIIPALPHKTRLLTRIDMIDNPDMREDPGGNPVVDWTKTGSPAFWFGLPTSGNVHLDPGSGWAARHSDIGSGTSGVDLDERDVQLTSNPTEAGVVVLGQTFVVQVAVWMGWSIGDIDIAIEIELLNGADAVVQSEVGSPLNGPTDITEQQLTFIQRTIVPTHADATKFRVRLTHMDNSLGLSRSVWSYLTLGMMFDVQPFDRFRVKDRALASLSFSQGAALRKRLRDSLTEVRFGYSNMYMDNADELLLRAFLADAETSMPFSIYRDRSRWLHTEDHFRHCVLTKAAKVDYQEGRLRTKGEWTAVVPRSEWKPQFVERPIS